MIEIKVKLTYYEATLQRVGGGGSKYLNTVHPEGGWSKNPQGKG